MKRRGVIVAFGLLVVLGAGVLAASAQQLTLNCSTGMSCSTSGSTFTMTASTVGLADSANSPVSNSGYTLQSSDCGKLLRFVSGGSAPTVPLSSGTGIPNCLILISDESAGSITFSRTSPDVFTVCNGSTCSTGQTSFALSSGQRASLGQTPSGVWQVFITQGSATNSGLPLVWRATTGSISATSSPGTTFLQTGSTSLGANTNYDVNCDFNWTTPTANTTWTVVGAISATPASPGWSLFGFSQLAAGGTIVGLYPSIVPPAAS